MFWVPVGGGILVAFLIWISACGAILGAVSGPDTAATPSAAPPTTEAAPPPAPVTTEAPPPSRKPPRRRRRNPSRNLSSQKGRRQRSTGRTTARKSRPGIDRLGKKGDCDGLQDEFDTADANDTAQRNRTGDGNADLMAYIDRSAADRWVLLMPSTIPTRRG